MHARTLLLSMGLGAALLALASAGCDSRLDPATRPVIANRELLAEAETALPGAPSQPGFYPLTVGNQWIYAQEFVVRLIPDYGEPPPPERYEETILRRIVGAQAIEGREYLIEQATTSGPQGVFETAIPYRQDVTGLYEWTPPIRASETGTPGGGARRIVGPAGRSPAERAAFERAARQLEERVATLEAALGAGAAAPAVARLPATASPLELIRLRYPLEPKAGWLIRDDGVFRLAAQVIGLETVDLPPGELRGYRIRLDSSALAPEDLVQVWYGPSGFLQMVGHFETFAYDWQGLLVGRVTWDQRQWLTDFTLASPLAIGGLLPRIPPTRK